MALQMTVDHPTGITVTNAYWRIAVVNLDYAAKLMTVEVRCYKNKNAWQQELATVAARSYTFTRHAYVNEDGDTVPSLIPWFQDSLDNLNDNIYSWLLTTSFFQGATLVT